MGNSDNSLPETSQASTAEERVHDITKERHALELRAEVINLVAGRKAERKGLSDRLEIGIESATDTAYGKEELHVGGGLTEEANIAETTGLMLSMTVYGKLNLNYYSDTLITAGGMLEQYTGGEVIAAGMSDNLLGGGGIRIRGADLRMNAASVVEEKVSTLAIDGLVAECCSTACEREEGNAIYSVGFASYKGTMEVLTGTTIRPMCRALFGVRTKNRGGGGGSGGDSNEPSPEQSPTPAEEPTPPAEPQQLTDTLLPAGGSSGNSVGDLSNTLRTATNASQLEETASNADVAIQAGRSTEAANTLNNLKSTKESRIASEILPKTSVVPPSPASTINVVEDISQTSSDTYLARISNSFDNAIDDTIIKQHDLATDNNTLRTITPSSDEESITINLYRQPMNDGITNRIDNASKTEVEVYHPIDKEELIGDYKILLSNDEEKITDLKVTDPESSNLEVLKARSNALRIVLDSLDSTNDPIRQLSDHIEQLKNKQNTKKSIISGHEIILDGLEKKIIKDDNIIRSQYVNTPLKSIINTRDNLSVLLISDFKNRLNITPGQLEKGGENHLLSVNSKHLSSTEESHNIKNITFKIKPYSNSPHPILENTGPYWVPTDIEGLNTLSKNSPPTPRYESPNNIVSKGKGIENSTPRAKSNLYGSTTVMDTDNVDSVYIDYRHIINVDDSKNQTDLFKTQAYYGFNREDVIDFSKKQQRKLAEILEFENSKIPQKTNNIKIMEARSEAAKFITEQANLNNDPIVKMVVYIESLKVNTPVPRHKIIGFQIELENLQKLLSVKNSEGISSDLKIKLINDKKIADEIIINEINKIHETDNSRAKIVPRKRGRLKKNTPTVIGEEYKFIEEISKRQMSDEIDQLLKSDKNITNIEHNDIPITRDIEIHKSSDDIRLETTLFETHKIELPTASDEIELSTTAELIGTNYQKIATNFSQLDVNDFDNNAYYAYQRNKLLGIFEDKLPIRNKLIEELEDTDPNRIAKIEIFKARKEATDIIIEALNIHIDPLNHINNQIEKIKSTPDITKNTVSGYQMELNVLQAQIKLMNDGLTQDEKKIFLEARGRNTMDIHKTDQGIQNTNTRSKIINKKERKKIGYFNHEEEDFTRPIYPSILKRNTSNNIDNNYNKYTDPIENVHNNNVPAHQIDLSTDVYNHGSEIENLKNAFESTKNNHLMNINVKEFDPSLIESPVIQHPIYSLKKQKTTTREPGERIVWKPKFKKNTSSENLSLKKIINMRFINRTNNPMSFKNSKPSNVHNPRFSSNIEPSI